MADLGHNIVYERLLSMYRNDYHHHHGFGQVIRSCASVSCRYKFLLKENNLMEYISAILLVALLARQILLYTPTPQYLMPTINHQQIDGLS